MRHTSPVSISIILVERPSGLSVVLKEKFTMGWKSWLLLKILEMWREQGEHFERCDKGIKRSRLNTLPPWHEWPSQHADSWLAPLSCWFLGSCSHKHRGLLHNYTPLFPSVWWRVWVHAHKMGALLRSGHSLTCSYKFTWHSDSLWVSQPDFWRVFSCHRSEERAVWLEVNCLELLLWDYFESWN